ncbi:uncharacterized protein [Apostichopus japonicus]|uniref:uncharacterized protein isoform X2 n=1 Tax=Stichopus japonicus TaxID=307972 RepID=UPI003AB7D799
MTYWEPTTAKCCSGLQAVHSIAVACKRFLGPERSIKFITEDDGCEAAFSTQKLLSLLDIEHPVGHLLRDACLNHSKRIGSGCTTLVCMAGTWANAIQSLLDEGISVETIHSLGDSIMHVCVDACKEEAIDCSDIIETLETTNKRPQLFGTESSQTKEMIQQNQVEQRSLLGADDCKVGPVDLSLEFSTKNLESSEDSKIDVNYSEDDLSWFFDRDGDESDSVRQTERDDAIASNRIDKGNSVNLSEVIHESVAMNSDDEVGWYFEDSIGDSGISSLKETNGIRVDDASPSNKASLDLLQVSGTCGIMEDAKKTRSDNGRYYEDDDNGLGERMSLTGRKLALSAEDDNLTTEQGMSNDKYSISDVQSYDQMVASEEQTKINLTSGTRHTRNLLLEHNQNMTKHLLPVELGNNDENLETRLSSLNVDVKSMKPKAPSIQMILRNSRHFQTTRTTSGGIFDEDNRSCLKTNGNKARYKPANGKSENLQDRLTFDDDDRMTENDRGSYHGNHGEPMTSSSILPPRAMVANSSSEGRLSNMYLSSNVTHPSSPVQSPRDKGLFVLPSVKCDDELREMERNGKVQVEMKPGEISPERVGEQTLHQPISCSNKGIQHFHSVASSSRHSLSPTDEDIDDERVQAFLNLCGSLSHGAKSSMNLAKQICLKQLQDNHHGDPFVCQVLGPSVEDSTIIDGLVLRCEVDQIPLVSSLRCNSLRAVLINGDLTPGFKHPGFKGPMEVKLVTDSLSQSARDSHSSWLDNIKQILQELKVSMILVKGHVDTQLCDYCLANDILVVSSVPFSALEYLSAVTNTHINVYFTCITQHDICDNLHIDCWEAGWHSVVRKLQTQQTAFIKITGINSLHTVVICGPSNPHVEEQRVKFWSSYHKLRDLLKMRYVCLGGAITELKVLRKLEEHKVSLGQPKGSRKVLEETRVLEAFQEGLEEFIIWLVSNQGNLSKFDIKTAIRNFVSASYLDTEAVIETLFSSRQDKNWTPDKVVKTTVEINSTLLTSQNSLTDIAPTSTSGFQEIEEQEAKTGCHKAKARTQSMPLSTDGFSRTDGVSLSVPNCNICAGRTESSSSVDHYMKTDTSSLLSETDRASRSDCKAVHQTNDTTHSINAGPDVQTSRDQSLISLDDQKSAHQASIHHSLPQDHFSSVLVRPGKTNCEKQTGFVTDRLSGSSMNIHKPGIVLDSVTSKTEAWENAWSLLKVIMSMDWILTTGLQKSQLQTHRNVLL